MTSESRLERSRMILTIKLPEGLTRIETFSALMQRATFLLLYCAISETYTLPFTHLFACPTLISSLSL